MVLNVKEICIKYGLSQTELSRKFSIPLRTVQDWYAGKRKPPIYVLSMMEELLKIQEFRDERR